MNWKPLALASASTLLLAAACGDTEPVETPPPSDTGMTDETGMADDAATTPDTDMADDTGMTSETGMDSQLDGSDTVSPLIDRLEGDWVSGEDDQSEMSILDGTATMMYDGEVLSTETLQAVDSCPDAVGEASDDMQLITMTSAESGETLCYGVVTLEADTLTLTSYPEGNTLTYTRQTTPVEPDSE